MWPVRIKCSECLVMSCSVFVFGATSPWIATHQETATRGQRQESMRTEDGGSRGCGQETGAAKEGVGALDAIPHILGPHAKGKKSYYINKYESSGF